MVAYRRLPRLLYSALGQRTAALGQGRPAAGRAASAGYALGDLAAARQPADLPQGESMTYAGNRELAAIMNRLNMMLARGVLVATTDTEGIQTMQMALLEGELADDVERFQSYGISAVPPAGGDALIAFIAGNRDHAVCLAVNDRTSRPKGQKDGEVMLYNDKECFVSLTTEGDVVVKGARNLTIEGVETVEIKAGQRITLTAPAVEINS
jgi:phage baseplate assembly protein V